MRRFSFLPSLAICLSLVVGFAFGPSQVVFAQQSSAGATVDREIDPEFAAKVRDVLLANPEILEEAFTALQERRAAEAANQRQQVISDNSELIFNSPNQAIMGNPDGDVTLVEFFDYNCGFCRRASADLTALIAQDPNLRVVIKEFPILGQESVDAARISVAVSRTAPDQYNAFHFALLESDQQANRDVALRAAEELGISMPELVEAAQPQMVDDNLAEVRAITSVLNITGTPAFILGNEVIEGAVGAETLAEMVAAMRACGEISCG